MPRFNMILSLDNLRGEEGQGSSKLTVFNWIWMVLGGLFWTATLLGLYAIYFMPDLAME